MQPNQMQATDIRLAMARYFDAEVVACSLILVVGLVSIALAIAIYFGKPAWRAAMIPLILVGLLEVIVGTTIVARTPSQVAALTTQLDTAPATFKADETARMTKVARAFATYKYAEITLFIVGLTLSFFTRNNPAYLSAGLALATQAIFALFFDTIAEHRAEVWLAALRTFTPS